MSGMQGILVTEKSLTFVEMINLVVDLIENIAGGNQCQLDLRMPVPAKRAQVKRRQALMTDEQGKCETAVGLQFFLVVIRENLHNLNILSLYANIFIENMAFTHYSYSIAEKEKNET